MNDTITAISTALGVGAISIIRVSGPKSFEIVNKITKNKRILEAKTHTIIYDHIVDNEKIIDEVLISVMKSPKTFTKEDIIEINCHGGIATTQKVLELLLINGARLAEPGEFTKRAFLNGRIDLIEAEGVMDLIEAKTDKARSLAINQVDGKVSNLIKNLRSKIVSLLANIEVNIDYPEYDDVLEITTKEIKEKLVTIESKIKEIINNSENGKILKDGITTVIIGRPNVGKSSLLNLLIDEDKAIVTDVEGTTRDIVEGKINLDGVILNIIDTAGIRETTDKVESIGVKKSKDLIKTSDLILFMLNNNEKLLEEDIEILNEIKDKNAIILINKCDLNNKLDFELLKDYNYIKISVLNNDGIDLLKKEIKKIFNLEKIETSDLTYLTNARSIALLKECLKSIKDVKIGLENNLTVDMLEIDIKIIWEKLGEIIGETYQDELIDQLFSQFCLGK